MEDLEETCSRTSEGEDLLGLEMDNTDRPAQKH